MIDSILHRHTDHVQFQNIIMPEEVVTDPFLIQEHVKNHFENWIRSNPYNDQDWANWQDEYKPKNNILPN